MAIFETLWAISSRSSGAAAFALRSSEVNLGLLAFRMVEVATLLADDKNWRGDVKGHLVDSMSMSEATRCLRACWSGHNCGRIRRGTVGQGVRCTLFRRPSSFARRFSSRSTYLGC